ncbi:hypothetical protein [Microbacterium esteraromaticum]|uniref:hypothetical protein n=1 Tax=Microbacterium esteraromaticum TaxID=57043 RepID=UPI0019D3D9B8|nr:hypothetical protein [Microbacterium esteraromaticum]MBN7794645.1 hypothetical protein [Microbacterium esteraromaticum]
MAKLMTLNELVGIARGAGIHLEPADEHSENLYVYADPRGNILYIGISGSSTPGKRSRDEERIAHEGYQDRVGVGFSALITENEAKRHRFYYDPETFNPTPLRNQIETENWQGDAIEKLKAHIEVSKPSLAEVEHALVRIPVCTGRLIGNSQYASQWEASVNRIPNVIAVIAADIARQAATLPADTTIATEGEVEKA